MTHDDRVMSEGDRATLARLWRQAYGGEAVDEVRLSQGHRAREGSPARALHRLMAVAWAPGAALTPSRIGVRLRALRREGAPIEPVGDSWRLTA